MRKTAKTIMAFLTAMTMTAGAVGFNAIAEERIIDASKEGISPDITDPDRYINLTERQRGALEWYKYEQPFNNGVNDLDEYFRENGLLSKALLVLCNTEKYGSIFTNHYVKVVYNYTHPEVKEAVEKFLKDRNDEGIWIEFCPVGEHEEEPTEITDIFEIAVLLNDFINDPANNIEKGFYNWVHVSVNDWDNDILTVQMMSQNDIEKVQAYMEKMNMKVPDSERLGGYESTIKWRIIERGDANNDGTLSVRDCACIANALASGEAESLPDNADYNLDTRKNVRDAAAISKDLANK